MHCKNPFERLEIKSDGSAYCCCEGWLPKPLGNVLESDLISIWHGRAAREIRESIVDQSFRFCSACPYLPGPGGPVTSSPPDDLQAIPSGRVRVLKLDYDLSCNLACPSCRVTHSKNFVDRNKVRRIYEVISWSEVLSVTDRLYVTGMGDPFASAHYWDLLQNLPSLPELPKLEVFLHTNGLLLDDVHWMALGPTRDRVSEVGISVDAATPDTYRQNRGGSWDKLWDNISFVNRLQAQNGGRPWLGFFFTVQANNYRELLPFVHLAKYHGARWMSVTALRNWGTFTREEYLARAVHLPGHPDHAEFREVISHPTLRDPGIVVDHFDPRYTDQDIICDDGALLPGSRPKTSDP